VDGSSPSRRALRNAIHLARHFDAQLTVLHVVREFSRTPGLIPTVQRGMEQHYLASETARFERFVEEFDFHKVPWKKVVRVGVPADAIVQTAREPSADLMVMGSVGRTGLSRILLGSVAGKVVRALPCSTIMVKAEDAIRLKVEEELSDLDAHYRQGCELLEYGFLEEARRQFEHCIRTSDMFIPGWQSLSEVYRRKGNDRRAEKCRETARHIEQTQAWRRVEADIRRTHPLWRRN
jgi:nucleotide-binding universal stress UspA family protein